MADVSHELGSIRHIVDSPLSSKVAMFNKVANQHNASQLLNPFASVDGRASPKPIFNKDEYGKPIAGSLTEMRGQKANIHVCKEMLELCQVINSEGFPDQENPELRIIFFGDLFNIYNYISDKVVGLLLRARKHKLVDFEGEILFQRRDDEVPIFLMKPIREIRTILEAKQDEFRRSVSPAPKPTTVLQDQMKRANNPRSAPTSKAASPQPEIKKINSMASATSLSNINDKPPTGKTMSTETLNNLTKPVANSITAQKLNTTPVTINIIDDQKEDKEEQIIDTKSLSSIAQTSLQNLQQENSAENLCNIQSASDILKQLDSDMSVQLDSEISVRLGSDLSMGSTNSQQEKLNEKESTLQFQSQPQQDEQKDMNIQTESQLQLQSQSQALFVPISYAESVSNTSLIKDLAQ